MWKTKLISVLCTLVLFACLAGVQAQGISQSASNVANAGTGSIVNQQISQTAVSQFSDFFKMPSVSAPKTHIEAPKSIKVSIPSKVYFGYQMQALPYSQYQTYAGYTIGNSLWVQGGTSWTQYAVVPQGSSLSLLATSSTGGNGYLYEINPNGQLSKNGFYFFPGSNQIGFYADMVGQHILLFVIDGQVSNSVIINVVAYYPPYQQPYYQQPNYQQPSYNSPTYPQSGYGGY